MQATTPPAQPVSHNFFFLSFSLLHPQGSNDPDGKKKKTEKDRVRRRESKTSERRVEREKRESSPSTPVCAYFVFGCLFSLFFLRPHRPMPSPTCIDRAEMKGLGESWRERAIFSFSLGVGPFFVVLCLALSFQGFLFSFFV